MKRPAIFFDRDNTLIANDGYLGDPAKVQLIPGAADAVARARALGYAAVVVSNQSGVARGLFDEGAVYVVNERMDALLRADNPAAVIDRHEFCPFHPEAVVERYRQDNELRKPKPGMLLKAAEKMALDLNRSWMVGDAPRDIEAGHAAGCRTILFKDASITASPAADDPVKIQPDHIATTLGEAIDFIATHPAPLADESPRPVAAQTPRTIIGSTTPRPVNRPPPAAVANAVAANPAGATTNSKPITPAASLPPSGAVDRRDGVTSTARLEALTEQILLEMRRRHEQGVTDFSLSKLLAGIVQVLVLAVLFMAYLRGTDPVRVQTSLLLAITMQTIAIALLLMSRHR